MKYKYIRRIIEVIFWAFFIGFPLLVFPALEPFFGTERMSPAFKAVLFTHAYLIAFYYFNYYYALPKFYFKRKYKIYFAVSLGALLFLLLVMMSNASFNPLSPERFRLANTLFVFSIVLRYLMIFLLSIGLASYMRLRQAEEEQFRAELSFLKAQINPHFLFNTLNSIYALTVKKSDSAPESVTRLASIMRYVITDALQDFVPLEKEIRYVSDYIDLERLRLNEKVKLNYTVTGTLEGKSIAPLIFIPLIENAFKHGVSTTEQSEISIAIVVKEQELELNVRNSKVRPDTSASNGLGIQNVKKRIDLLYSGKYNLNIEQNEKEFSVNLALKLK